MLLTRLNNGDVILGIDDETIGNFINRDIFSIDTADAGGPFSGRIHFIPGETEDSIKKDILDAGATEVDHVAG